MARRIRASKLETRSSRLKLPVRRKPYFVTVALGIAVGYRRNSGAGTWSVRASDGHGSGWLRAFATADDHEDKNGETVLDFWQAQDKARALARGGEGHGDRPATVAEAVDAYEDDLKARGASKDNASSVRFHLTSVLAVRPVSLLTAKELRAWRNSIVKSGLKPASADRVGKSFKAALNLATADDDRITNAKAWREGLAQVSNGEEIARNVILPDETIVKVVKASYDLDRKLGILVEVLAACGTRESQALRLQVRDLQDDPVAPRLMMPSSRKGRNRKITYKPVSITPSLAVVLRERAAGRSDNAPLLESIPRFNLHFRTVADSLKLEPEVTPYCLRHSSVVRQLLGGVPIRVVAAYHDTSVAMIEKHYSRFIIGDPTDALTRRTLLDMAAPAAVSNVVPIGGR